MESTAKKRENAFLERGIRSIVSAWCWNAQLHLTSVGEGWMGAGLRECAGSLRRVWERGRCEQGRAVGKGADLETVEVRWVPSTRVRVKPRGLGPGEPWASPGNRGHCNHRGIRGEVAAGEPAPDLRARGSALLLWVGCRVPDPRRPGGWWLDGREAPL